MHSRPIFTFIIGALLLAGNASAQITLTNEQYQSPLGDTLVSVNINQLTLQPAYYAPPAEGPDQQWDYRWLEYTNFEVDPEPIFNDPELPTVNNVDQNVAIGDFTPDSPIPLRIFERYDDNGKFLVGGEIAAPFTAPLLCGTCTDGDSVRYSTAMGDNLFEEEEPLLQLPLQYEDTWSADYTRTLTMQLFLPTFGLEDVPAQQTDSVSVTSEVVGWGSLTIPNLTYSGTQDLEVLLLKQTLTQRSFYTVDGNPAPQALLDTLGVEQGQTLVLTFYQFYAPGLDQPALQFTFNQAGQVFNYSVAASIQDVNPEEEGTFVQKTTMHDGVERSYWMYTPPGYDGSEDLPLVMALHGYSSVAKQMTWQSQYNYVADTAGFLVVYPQGLLVEGLPGGPLPPVAPGWNVPDGPLASGTDDVGFLGSLVGEIQNDYAVDANRVYVSGISNGGFMSSVMAAARPDLFAAMGVSAGVIPVPRQALVPTMIIHGTADPLVPYTGDTILGIPPVPETFANYGLLHGCSTDQIVTELPDLNPNDGTTVTRIEFPNCTGDADLVLYRVNGGSHVWEGVGDAVPPVFAPVIGNTISQDIHAGVELWNFMKQYTTPHARLLSQSVQLDTTEREYLLYVPAAYDGSEDWPLVLNLHGFLGFPEEQVFGSQMNPVADTAHFLVAYPKGLLIDGNAFEEGGEPDFGTGWNITGTLSDNDDYAFIEDMMDQITMEYAVNESRIYVSGFSLGGLMSQNLVCSMSDRFAAVAAVSFDLQAPDILACEPGRAVPMLYMHGTNDFIVPYMETPGFIGAEGTVDFWVDNNGCSMDSTVTMFPDIDTTDGSTVTRMAYQNCEGDSEVWFYRIDGGGHAWPGGELVPPAFADFLGNLNKDINASSEIWNFFNRHSLPQPQLLTKTIMVDTTEREYLLYVPAAYDGSEDWPLVLNLHGFLGFPEEQIFGSQMNPVADTAHFLVAYPKGLLIDANAFGEGGEPDFGTGWNITGTLSDNDDYAFMGAMLDQITMEYAVDESRVFASGFSLGGLMSQNMACSMSDRFAAVAAVSFDLQGPEILACEPGRAVPMFYMHGTNDFIVPYMETPGFFGAEGTVDFWVDNNGCSMDSTVTMFPDIDTADGSTVTRTAYQNCEGDSEVWFYRIDGGGHAWPGGELVPPAFAAFLGNLNRDINGSSEIWNFFNRQQLVTSTGVVPSRAFDVRVFPNPVSDQLNLEFTLPSEAPVSLQLLSPLGQTVANLFEGRLPAGEQRITLQAEQYRISQGLYFYQLRIGDQLTSGQIVWQ